MKFRVFFYHLFFLNIIFSQIVSETFNSTRIINGHSNETLKKRHFEYRIEHRFGDFAGVNGGAQNGYGFDNASDIRFAAEYGISDKLMAGIGRSKGSVNAYRNVIDWFVKYKIKEQEENGFPISLTFLSSFTFSYAKKSSDFNSISYFPENVHRIAYANQLILTRKFGSRVSLAIIPSYIHRNFVKSNDQNGIFATGGAMNFKLTKTLGLLLEYYHNFTSTNVRNNFRNPLSLAFEWATNGHNFHFSISNSSLFNETQFIPATTEDWGLGQYRIGFSIARTFKIK
jgi:hypothetical protein